MFRIGTTSYIVPDDILANATYLAPLVDDVELVLFESEEYGSNLPDATLCTQLAAIATANGLTYTVHLPLDLRLADDGGTQHPSLHKARRVIEATRALSPFAYTLHLDGSELLGRPLPVDLGLWQERALRALTVVCDWVSDPAVLCLENVERWDPEAFAPVLDRLPISRCIDVGHLWLEGRDPLPLLPRWNGRTRTVHLHGIAERDHASLAHVPAELLDPVVAYLQQHFRGVVTLEVFGEEDLRSSLEALNAALARVR
ncbi:MAG: cobamide remodeling phosphodiesterase CbiR [Anaerolineae bacterium]